MRLAKSLVAIPNPMPLDIRIRFGRAIRRLPEEQGINQEEAAERCGLHRTYLDIRWTRYPSGPLKADPPLVIDANAVLALSIPLQGFEPVFRYPSSTAASERSSLRRAARSILPSHFGVCSKPSRR